jgi:putative membrane protein
MLLPPEALLSFTAGMVVGWSVCNAIPSILLGAADESAVFTVLPGQMFLMRGRGYEATLLTAAGWRCGLAVLVAATPLLPRLLPAAHAVLRPHYHWMIWCIITLMLMSEWPKEGTRGQGGWRKLLAGWKTPGAGLLTFALSGFLGFILFYRSPVAVDAGFQNLMPAFVGLFGTPWLLLNVASRAAIPPQSLGRPPGPAGRTLAQGVAAGVLGGGLAAFLPGITGGVGGWLAGHATGQRDSRVFLVAQGASKAVYYAGALVLGFVPGLRMTRGGAGWLIRGLHAPAGYGDFWTVTGAVALAGAIAFGLVGPLARVAVRISERWAYQRISAAALAFTVALVVAATGGPGLLIMLAATGIGLIPLLYGSRRMNCLGVVLLPIACSLSDAGAPIAAWLGLLAAH